MTLSSVPGQVVDSLKGQPVLVAILLVNLATVCGLFFVAISVNGARSDLIEKLIERCMPTGPARRDMSLFAAPALPPRHFGVSAEN
jgi:hypothetical protein